MAKAPNYQINKIISKKTAGQALVEYALVVFLMVSVAMVIDYRIRKSMGSIWLYMTRQVAPGCAGCEYPDSLK